MVMSLLLPGSAYRRMWLPGDGGYSDKEITPGSYEVVFRGPAYFSHERCLEYAMLRAAEITLEKHQSHFEILSSLNEDFQYSSAPTSSFELKSDGRGDYTNEITFDPTSGVLISLPTVRIKIRLNSENRGYSAQTVQGRVRKTM